MSINVILSHSLLLGNSEIAVDCLTEIGRQLSRAQRREIVRQLTQDDLNTSKMNVEDGEV